MCGTLRLKYIEPTCKHCVLRRMLLRSSLEEQESDPVQQLNIHCKGPYRSGERIYSAGDRFRSVYVITSGAVKTEVVTQDGDVQVTGFYLPGQSIGFESVGGRSYPVDAVALEETRVCEVNFERLETLSSGFPALQHEILVLLGNEIRNAGYRRMLIRNLPAPQRLLCFLNDLRQRLSMQLEEEVRELPLPMQKEDIAKYLSLAPETLSRTLVRLGRAGVIRNKLKSIELLDMAAITASQSLCH